MFNSEAKFGQCLFQGCVNLAEFASSELPSPQESALQARTGESHACDSCRLLESVDLCNTNVEEIPEFTFVHCTGFREVLLPKTLHTIRVKAFL